MVRGINIQGKKFGLLTVLHEVPQEERKNKRNRCHIVQCDCGSPPFEIEQRNLTRTGVENPKLTQSCGCIRLKAAFVATNKFGVSMEYLDSFDDLEKFFFIHKQLVKIGKIIEFKESYEEYIETFYYGENFNKLYSFWKNNVAERGETFYDLWKPSIDHKTPLSRGGTNELSNLHFITLFENLAKRDMTWEEWEKFKEETNFGSKLMIGGGEL